MKYKVWVSIGDLIEEDVVEVTGMWPSVIDERDFLVKLKQDELLRKIGVDWGSSFLLEDEKENKGDNDED